MMRSLVDVSPGANRPAAMGTLSVDGLQLDPVAWDETGNASGNNSNILYIAVEYVKGNPDFKLETESDMSPQQTFNEFEQQHVSPLDPNMCSVARYSPVYTSESNASYENPVVVTQVVSTGAENIPTMVPDNMQAADLQQQVAAATANQYLQMVHNDAVNAVGDANMQIVPHQAEQEVDILITDQSTGISYLVERCLADDSQLLDPDTLLDSELLALDENTLKSQLSEMMMDTSVQSNVINVNTIRSEHNSERVERRSQRHITNGDEVRDPEEEFLNCVQEICDKPILSRARASLPESHLVLNKSDSGDTSVFAKKFIPKRTRFGPIEGILTSDLNFKTEMSAVVLTVELNGIFQLLDVSNENLSNWMCFVQLAKTFEEQNLVLNQINGALYYTTMKNILPKQQLLVGYGANYAQIRNLPVLEPQISEEDMWPCYECSAKFVTSDLLQKHLDEHDTISVNPAKKRRKTSAGNANNSPKELQCSICFEYFEANNFDILRQHLEDHGLNPDEQMQSQFIIVKKDIKLESSNNLNKECLTQKGEKDLDDSENKYRCTQCYKSFAYPERLQKHMMVHGAEETKPLQCDKCNKRFLNNSALTIHKKTHFVGGKLFECPICKEQFDHVLQLKMHVTKHCVDDHYTCPHCDKLFDKYSIIRKHIRAFHCERKHECPDCSKPFPTLDKLRLHLLKHSDHREFLCADCGKQFKRKDKLNEHIKRKHSEERENASPSVQDKDANNSGKKFTPKVLPTDYERFIYKCHTCLLGFKRRGMLVNHLAKRHPDIRPDSVPELNLPIFRATKDYYCNYCDKVYKSSSKRKAHILKNHPGSALPLSNRRFDASKASSLPNPTFSRTVGSVTADPQACQWCHKQYASRAKLLQHQRKKHQDMLGLQGLKNEEDKLADEYLVGEIGHNVDGQYFHLVPMEGTQYTQPDHIGGNSRLYRLLTTGNNMVPPR